MITFDALTGNTDRHPENWGLLFRRGQGSPSQAVGFAPAFDNGTSLGYEQAEAKLIATREPVWLDRYIDKGSHHCGWDLSNDGRAPHVELCARYLDAYPEAGVAMRNVVQFEASRVTEIVDQCAAFDVGVPFSADRAKFVSALVYARRARLSAVLGD